YSDAVIRRHIRLEAALTGVLTTAFRGTLPKMGGWHVRTEASVSRTLARGVVPNFASNKPLQQSAVPWRFVTASLYQGPFGPRTTAHGMAGRDPSHPRNCLPPRT